MRSFVIEIAFITTIIIITLLNLIASGRVRRENNRSEDLILRAHCENVRSETYLREAQKNIAIIEAAGQEIKERTENTEIVWLGDLSGFSIQPDRDSGESGDIWLIHRCGFQRMIEIDNRYLANIVKYAMEHRTKTCAKDRREQNQ